MSFNAKDMTQAVRLRPCVSACSARSPISCFTACLFFLDTRWSDFMGKNKLADVCERLYLLVVYHAGRHAGFNQVPASI